MVAERRTEWAILCDIVDGRPLRRRPCGGSVRGQSSSYRQTLAAVVDALGPELPIGKLDPARLERLLEQRWGKAAPATWNRQLATLRSFLSFCRRRSWVADARLEAKRRREHEDRTSVPGS
jgi:site-specific recombinase XerD